LGGGGKFVQINKAYDPSLAYSLDVSGAVNANAFYVNGDVLETGLDGLSTNMYSKFFDASYQSLIDASGNPFIATSSDGKYIITSNYNSAPKARLSTDYGATFIDISNVSTNNGSFACAMSSTGQYMYISGSAAGSSYRSADYGATFTTTTTSFCTAVSGSGKYVISGIFLSSDYGVTFNAAYSSSSNIINSAISNTGQIIVVINNNGSVLISRDFGKSWTTILSLGVRRIISMSATGKFILVGGNLSVDYGKTFNLISGGPPDTYYSGSVISANGQYMVVSTLTTAYVSIDYGKTWTTQTMIANTVDQAGTCLAMPSNASYVLIASKDGIYKRTNLLPIDVSINSAVTKSTVDASLALYTTKSTVDASLALYYTMTAIDSSINTNYYNKSYIDANYYTKSLTDTSINDAVTAQIAALVNAAPPELDTLKEIATALQSDASFGVHVYARIDRVDASANAALTQNDVQDTSINSLSNNLNTNYYTKTYIDNSFGSYYTKDQSDASYASVGSVSAISTNLSTNYSTTSTIASTYATQSSLSSYVQSGTSNDVSFNGNVRLGGGTNGVGINKASTAYALDVSGTTLITGNLSIAKNPSDANYSYFDMTNVNMAVYNVSEKFSTFTFSATPTLDYSSGGMFYTTATGDITTIEFTNVPSTQNRTVSITVLMAQSSGTYYFSGTTNSVTINGTQVTPLRSSAVAAPSSSTMVIHQFVIIWTAVAEPTVLVYMSGLTAQ
jgi:hypothetical protein